jgi:hypothetical protein
MRKKGSPEGPRPHLWVTGSDPLRHDQYRAFIQARNQARWRGETWNLSFEQYEHLWAGQWHLRSRDSDGLSMSRTDRSQPWQVDNCFIATRTELNRRQVQYRRPRGANRPKDLV